VAVLRSELDRLRKLGALPCSDPVADQLKRISASTMDRLLGREKRIRQLRRNRNPNVQRLIYQKVPVKVAADWDTSEIGNGQVDLVAHCGRSTGGDYIHTNRPQLVGVPGDRGGFPTGDPKKGGDPAGTHSAVALAALQEE
jgi:hypothetical protein